MKEDPAPRKSAVALRYQADQDSAPRVTAKGFGKIAEKIIETAQQYGIPIQEDADIVTVLSTLDLDEEIPPALYKAVAEILAFVYRTNREALQPKNP